jgi:DNA-binding MarR family transcriptional regulator
MTATVVIVKTIRKKTISPELRDSVDRHVELWSKELSWLDPLEEAIFIRVSIIARHASTFRREALQEGDLRTWQFKVLLALRRLGPPYIASPSELADALGLTRGALSSRLRVLEEAGFITRTTDLNDRRRVHVQLTDAGSEAFERQAGSEQKRESAALAALSGDDRQTLADLLREVCLAIESER